MKERHMFRFVCLAAAACAIVLNITASGLAQGRMGMNSSSAFGSSSGLRPLGQAGFGATQFGSGLGSSGMGGFGGGGMVGLGMGGFGGGGFGSSGGGIMGGMGFGNQMSGGMGMNGGMGGQNFVGRDGGDMNAVMSQMGRAGTQFFNTMSQNMRGRNNRNRQQPEMDGGENERQEIRIRLEVGFAG
jgi:hypothetical protein